MSNGAFRKTIVSGPPDSLPALGLTSNITPSWCPERAERKDRATVPGVSRKPSRSGSSPIQRSMVRMASTTSAGTVPEPSPAGVSLGNLADMGLRAVGASWGSGQNSPAATVSRVEARATICLLGQPAMPSANAAVGAIRPRFRLTAMRPGNCARWRAHFSARRR